MAAIVMMQRVAFSNGNRISMVVESRFNPRWTPLPVLEVKLGPGQHRVITRISLKADVF